MQKFTYLVTLAVMMGICIPSNALQAQQNRTVADFSLPDPNGTLLSLKTLADSNLIAVIFTSSHCAWATKYQERIVDLHTSFAPKGVAFLAINANDSRMNQRDAVARMRQQTPFPFPYLKDKQQLVAKNFGVTRNPEVVLLKHSEGKFEVLYQGKIDDNPLDAGLVRHTYLVDAMEAALGGRKIAEPFTEPSGCHIRWKMEANPE